MKIIFIYFIILLIFNNIINAQDISYENIIIIWATGDGGEVLKSVDDGETWFFANNGIFTTSLFKSIFFSDRNTGWVVGMDGKIYKTSDAGNNWFRQTSGTMNTLQSVFFVNSDTGWIAASSGEILKTINSGEIWTIYAGNHEQLLDIHFINSKIGWAVGGTKNVSTDESRNIILKTIDGGESWYSQNCNTSKVLHSVFFVNSNVGWAVGEDATIISTIDGGDYWQCQISGFENQFYKPNFNTLYFINENLGFTAGGNMTILKTNDGGTNWTPINLESVGEITTIHFYDNIHGFVIYYNHVGIPGVPFGSYLIKTVDSGITWSQCGHITAEKLYDMTTTVASNNTSVHTKSNYPKQNFILYDNFPNPFNENTNIKVELVEKQDIELTVYDINGKFIIELYSGKLDKGSHIFSWYANNIPSGIYFIRYKSNRFNKVVKCTLLK